jgi:hypothetical protein
LPGLVFPVHRLSKKKGEYATMSTYQFPLPIPDPPPGDITMTVGDSLQFSLAPSATVYLCTTQPSGLFSPPLPSNNRVAINPQQNPTYVAQKAGTAIVWQISEGGDCPPPTEAPGRTIHVSQPTRPDEHPSHEDGK